MEQTLNLAENPGTRLCTLCGRAQELTPMLNGFDHITEYPGFCPDPPSAERVTVLANGGAGAGR
ncbi:hypothetical protein [Streptomyces sp. NPDC003032]